MNIHLMEVYLVVVIQMTQKFNITGLFVDSGSISNSNEILTFGSLTSSFNSIIGSIIDLYVDSEGTYVTDKKVRFDLSVSKIGVDGVNGASGSSGKGVKYHFHQINR